MYIHIYVLLSTIFLPIFSKNFNLYGTEISLLAEHTEASDPTSREENN